MTKAALSDKDLCRQIGNKKLLSGPRFVYELAMMEQGTFSIGLCAAAWGAAFFCGSIPFGYLAGRCQGIDVRKHGSGNIGSTNVFRVLGKKWGIAVFLADFFKGALPMALILGFLAEGFPGLRGDMLFVGTALAAILGHNYTPWLGFKGGKGIAVSAGVLLVLIPKALAAVLVVWLVLFALTRTVSIASIAASVLLPPAAWVLYPGRPVIFFFCLAAGLLGLWRHRGNIQRLRAGTESKIERKARP